MSENIDLLKWNKIFLEKFNENPPNEGDSDTIWTEKIRNLIHINVRNQMEYKKDCICYSYENPPYNKEYMGIDMTWMDDESYQIPDLLVELENERTISKIAYCFWKLYCQKSKSKILIAYPKNKKDLLNYLQDNFKELDEEEEYLLILGKKPYGEYDSYLIKKRTFEKIS